MESTPESKGRILGIGGIFFKSPEAENLRAWYNEKLGFAKSPSGHFFQWRSSDDSAAEHLTIWSIFPAKSAYFDPSAAPFMINYIVDDLDALLEKLKAAGVSIDPKRDDHEYGRFAWIYDPEGHKLELWQPPAPPAA